MNLEKTSSFLIFLRQRVLSAGSSTELEIRGMDSRVRF